jgi:hypothetical protein
MINLPDPADTTRIAAFITTHAGWSIYWDKRYGVWRASEDDPLSGLYAEDTNAGTVIAYIAAHD